MDGAGQPALSPLSFHAPRSPFPVGTPRTPGAAHRPDRGCAAESRRRPAARAPGSPRVVGPRRGLAPALGTSALWRADRVRLDRSLPAHVLRARRTAAAHLDRSRRLDCPRNERGNRIMTRRLLPLLLCLTLASAMTPLPRMAHADGEAQAFNEDKFWLYAGCAAGIALAVGAGAWIVAGIACGKAITAYWTD